MLEINDDNAQKLNINRDQRFVDTVSSRKKFKQMTSKISFSTFVAVAFLVAQSMAWQIHRPRRTCDPLAPGEKDIKTQLEEFNQWLAIQSDELKEKEKEFDSRKEEECVSINRKRIQKSIEDLSQTYQAMREKNIQEREDKDAENERKFHEKLESLKGQNLEHSLVYNQTIERNQLEMELEQERRAKDDKEKEVTFNQQEIEFKEQRAEVINVCFNIHNTLRFKLEELSVGNFQLQVNIESLERRQACMPKNT
jgi:hypothetical protein